MLTPLKKKKLCFVIMPFAKNRFEVYKRAIEPACKEAKFKAVRVDELKGVYNINRKIIEHIFKSEVVIAELTDMNPNVFYEMGVAHTIDNKTIMITQSAEKLPFDISNYRCIVYDQSDDGFKKLQEELAFTLQTINVWSKEPCNPVQDFKPVAPFVPVREFQDLQKALQERENELLRKDSLLKQAIAPAEFKSLRSEFIEKEKGYKLAISQLEAIKAELEKKNAEISKLQQELQTYSIKLKSLQNEAIEKEKGYKITVSQLETVKAELEKKNAEINKLNQELQTYLRAVQRDAMEKEKDHKITVSQLETAKTELDRKNAEIRKLKQELQTYSYFIAPAGEAESEPKAYLPFLVFDDTLNILKLIGVKDFLRKPTNEYTVFKNMLFLNGLARNILEKTKGLSSDKMLPGKALHAIGPQKFYSSYIDLENIIQQHEMNTFLDAKLVIERKTEDSPLKVQKKDNQLQKLHQRAVEYHSQAFDLEAKRAASAKLMWQKALDYWGRLLRSEEFWQSVQTKGQLLEPSFFGIDQLKDSFPKFLLEIHINYILNYIDTDTWRAGYHFELIRSAHLGRSDEESQQLRGDAIQHIYRIRFLEDLLEQKEERYFEAAFSLAEPVHFLDPTDSTAAFILKIHLAWARKLESDQLDFIRENYPEYFKIIAGFEYIRPSSEVFAKIRNNDEIQSLQKKQLTLIGSLEAALIDALKYCNIFKPSNSKMISEAHYFVGRYYCKDGGLLTATNHLEEAIKFDLTNVAARKLLEEVNIANIKQE